MVDFTETDKKRFWDKVEKTNTCWVWTGAKTDRGYGCFQFKKKTYSVHRLSFFLSTRIWPGKLQINHLCNNPGCVRPDHLDLGTQKDNMQYASQCGRLDNRKGENNPMYGIRGEQNPKYGMKHSEESKQKMRDAKRPLVSEETKQKQREAALKQWKRRRAL